MIKSSIIYTINSHYPEQKLMIDKSESNTEKVRRCWFCDIKCNKFVSICDDCTHKKFVKKFSKNKKNI